MRQEERDKKKRELLLLLPLRFRACHFDFVKPSYFGRLDERKLFNMRLLNTRSSSNRVGPSAHRARSRRAYNLTKA